MMIGLNASCEGLMPYHFHMVCTCGRNDLTLLAVSLMSSGDDIANLWMYVT